ncbi:hypothetical protein DPSP01_013450 [Paraphaeosphaeria sporulosa]
MERLSHELCHLYETRKKRKPQRNTRQLGTHLTEFGSSCALLCIRNDRYGPFASWFTIALSHLKLLYAAVHDGIAGVDVNNSYAIVELWSNLSTPRDLNQPLGWACIYSHTISLE